MIHEFFMEFGYDMAVGVPTAYWLHERRRLTKTIGPLGSRAMYFFSPDHVEVDRPRLQGWHNAKTLSLPTTQDVHQAPIYHWPTWSLPPFQDHYHHAEGQTIEAKPLVIIFNKHCTQWNEPLTLNHISLKSLLTIIGELRARYRIIYARWPWAEHGAEPVPWNDFAVLRHAYPEVMFMHEMVHADTWNGFQFQLCANAAAILSVQGGTAIMASFFRTRNFVFLRQGKEVHYDSVRWYSDLAGADVQYVRFAPSDLICPTGNPGLTMIHRDIQQEYVDMVLDQLLHSDQQDNFIRCVRGVNSSELLA